jgi:hypothetical protein
MRARTGRVGCGTQGHPLARAPTRFWTFPDDIGVAPKGYKPVTGVGPFLKLFDGHVIAGLASGAAAEKCSRDVDHVLRALALIKQWNPAPGAEASGRVRLGILEASDASLALHHVCALAPTADIGRVRGAVGAPARRGVIVPGPESGKINL